VGKYINFRSRRYSLIRFVDVKSGLRKNPLRKWFGLCAPIPEAQLGMMIVATTAHDLKKTLIMVECSGAVMGWQPKLVVSFLQCRGVINDVGSFNRAA
jgi:hypothetical protein